MVKCKYWSMLCKRAQPAVCDIHIYNESELQVMNTECSYVIIVIGTCSACRSNGLRLEYDIDSLGEHIIETLW